jgi:hypothetical protein
VIGPLFVANFVLNERYQANALLDGVADDYSS